MSVMSFSARSFLALSSHCLTLSNRYLTVLQLSVSSPSKSITSDSFLILLKDFFLKLTISSLASLMILKQMSSRIYEYFSSLGSSDRNFIVLFIMRSAYCHQIIFLMIDGFIEIIDRILKKLRRFEIDCYDFFRLLRIDIITSSPDLFICGIFVNK